MPTKVTAILSSEVNLVVVGTVCRTIQHIAIVGFNGIEVGGGQIVKRTVVTAGRRIEVLARTITAVHGVEREARTILVGLVVVDTLRVRELQLQALQNLTPTEVVADAGVDARVVGHVAAVVTIVLQHVEVVELVLVLLTTADTVGRDIVAVDLLRNIAWTGEQQVIVLLVARATYLHQRGVLLAIVTTDSQIGRQIVGNLHVDTGTIVPAVVVELT